MIRMTMFARAIVAATLCLCLTQIGCQKKNAQPSDGKIQVVATIFPIADMVRQVGGRHVNVQCLVEAGSSPHDFQIKARHARMLAQARLVVMVGMGLDQWAATSAEMAQRHKADVLVLSKFAESPSPKTTPDEAAVQPENEGEHGSHHHDHAHGNPHIWLSPVIMQKLAAAVADELSKIDPANRDDYAASSENFIKELKALDQEYREKLSQVKQKNFVTFHEAFTYIADQYGLHQIALEEPNATEYNVGQLNRVRQFIRQNSIKVIFVEPQFPPDKLEQLARETGARVDKLDPEGGQGIKGYDSYLAMMRSNLETMVKAMRD